MAAIVIGPTFPDELQAAGLNPATLPIAWSPDGQFTGREKLTQAQNDIIDSVLARHDPTQTTYLASTLDMGGTTAEIMGED